MSQDRCKHDKERTSTRRTALKQIGSTSVLVVGGLSGVASAASTSNEDGKAPEKKYEEFYHAAVDQYGKSEANVAVNIVDRKLRAKKRKGWDAQTTNQKIGDAIIAHPKTPRSSKDIQNYRQRTTSRKTNSAEAQQQSTTQAISTSAQGLSLDYDNSEKYAVYNTRAAVDTDTGSDSIWAVSNASLYGSGYAWGRLYGRYFPSTSGTLDVTCQYEIQGYVRNATCEVSLYVREDGQGPIFELVDDINTGIDDTRTRTASFDVDANEGYNVGVELYTESQAGGDPAAVSDVYNTTALNGRRHFQVLDFKIE